MERFFIIFVGLFVANLSFAREPLPKELAAPILAEFQYEASYQVKKNEGRPMGLLGRCWKYDQVIQTGAPQLAEPLDIQQSLFIPNRSRLGEKKIPTVIMIPPLGGVNPLDTEMAKSFCRDDMAAILIENDFANVEHQAEVALLPVEDHQRTFYRISAAVKAALIQIERDPNLTMDQVGIFGVSLGGILSSFVMATEPHIGAGYFIVAGGDIPEILAYSDQEKVKKIRNRRMDEQNFATEKEYEDYLREHLTFDPIDIAVTMLPETLYMVIAGEDANVQTANQWLLHQAFGEPELDLLENAGHTDAILDSLLFSGARQRVVNFFEERFSLPNERPSAFEFLNSFRLSVRE